MPEFHRTTLTLPDGIEIVVRRGRVTQRRAGAGSTLIPPDGFIISAAGKARVWASRHLYLGAGVEMQTKLLPLESNAAKAWQRAAHVVGGGPQLVKDGQVAITADLEKIGPAFVNDRHPRTAVARLTDGRILFVTIDGRQPGVSHGLALPALAELLVRHGAAEAINLDGGGSTTLVINNQIANKPSDATGERNVSGALLIFRRYRPKEKEFLSAG